MNGFWGIFVERLPTFLPLLLVGFQVSLIVAAGSFVIAMSLGLLLAIARLSGHRSVAVAAGVYIEFIRGTPALTQLFIIYFGLAYLGFNLPGLVAAIVGLGLNGAAYVAEIFRAGLIAVPDGQRQAALSLGLTPFQTFRHVRVPQAFRMMLPPFCNYAIQLIKDTSLASVVAAPEIMFRARALVMETYLSMQIYVLVGIMYLCVSIPLAILAGYLQRRNARMSAGAAA
jgi:polar amino acid transport system permease protein/cystine transport system permease protein